ncbi:hypothetical protein FQR65_LT07039 [Abscondita terminalis]|nr:hypothetical protein FQR65_LT07039 [Abscondita terminalis]
MSSQLIKEIDFEGVKALGNDDNVLVIDVREPKEIQETGSIPGSINIPSGSVEKALNLDEDDFHSLYGHQKPPKDFPLIFSCRSGTRSLKASVIAVQLGYTE